MTTTKKQDLYIANDLEELNKRVAENPMSDKLKFSTCSQISHMMEATWKEAKKAEDNFDEERAYILYMRLFSSLTAMKEAKDIVNNQPTLQYFQKGAIIWLEKATELSESLKSRYDEKLAIKLEAEKRIQEEIDEEKSLTTSIKPKILYKYLMKKKKNILLIDLRLKFDYDQSHMRTSACIHIPADLTGGKGWTPWGIESALTDESARKKFQDRANFDFIVLFDANSYENDLQMGHPLLGLKQAIFHYDRDVKLKREPLILEGGYEDWMQFYPGESTAPLPLRKNNDLQTFEIAYPEDRVEPVVIPSEPPVIIPSEPELFIPQIDRTRKPFQQPTKIDSPTIETIEEPIVEPVELPSMPDRSKKPSTTTIIESPTMPDRTKKPSTTMTTTESESQENVCPTPLRPEIPSQPKPIDNNRDQNDANQENIPQIKPTPSPVIAPVPLPNREGLEIYRPFRGAAIQPSEEKNSSNVQTRFDSVTGRKIFVDTKTNQYVTNISDNENNKIVPKPIPTVDRTIKPLLTENDRRQIAMDYRAVLDQIQPNRRTGLKNLGNSCYMNSVIQSLGFHFILTNYFLTGEFNRDINVNNKFGSRGIVVREWFRLMYGLWSEQFTCLSPIPFKQTVGNIQRVYLGSQQQDAHEFLVFLLDALHEDLNQAPRPRLEELKSENFKTDFEFAKASKRAFQQYNKSIIVDLFFGLFKSTVICSSCSFKSVGFEAFAVNSVPIPPVRQCSLFDCFDLFREVEYLTGENKYQCSKCKRLSDKQRRLEIWELPKIFIVHFKRFRLQHDHYIKNESLIRYPISNVDFSRWSQTTITDKYSLVAVVNHYGSLNSGHYTSFCHDGKNWFYCDDQSIRLANPQELERNVHAYLLFYSSMRQPNLRLPTLSA